MAVELACHTVFWYWKIGVILPDCGLDWEGMAGFSHL